MEKCLPVFNCIFFCCKYQLSFLLHFRVCHLAKCWNRKVYLLHRICKEKKVTICLSVCPLAVDCSSDLKGKSAVLIILFFTLPTRNGPFLLLLWVLSPGAVPYMLPLNHRYLFCIVSPLFRVWPSDITDERWEEELARELQVISDQLVISRILFLCSMFILLLMSLQMF